MAIIFTTRLSTIPAGYQIYVNDINLCLSVFMSLNIVENRGNFERERKRHANWNHLEIMHSYLTRATKPT